ncbi:MAG: hypothetical protein ABI594_12540 [Ginsengibacter sp.]
MQDFIERLFNISHDASASLIVTLTIFILGYIITATVFIISKYFERKSNRKIFLDNLKSLNKSVLRQQTAFLDTINSLNIVTNSPWEYSKVEFFQIPVFKEMSFKESLKCFFFGLENQLAFWRNKKLRRHAFNKTWENITNVQFWSDRALNDFYPILDKYNQHGERRNAALRQLREMWEQLFLFAKNEPGKLSQREFEYVKLLDNTIAAYQKIPTNQRVIPYITHRKLILPIRILNRKYETLPLVANINNKAHEVSTHYHEMEIFIRNTRIQYKTYHYAFRRIQKTNEMIVDILN